MRESAPESSQGLIQPTDTKAELNGYRLKKFRTLDWERHFEAAVKSFEVNGFFLSSTGSKWKAWSKNWS